MSDFIQEKFGKNFDNNAKPEEVVETIDEVTPEVKDTPEEPKEVISEEPKEDKSKGSNEGKPKGDEEEPKAEFIEVAIGENNDDKEDLVSKLREKGFEIESLDDLKAPPKVNEELLTVQRFMEATGKSAKEYYDIFQDYDKMDEDKLIQKYYQEIGVTPKMLELKMEEMKLKNTEEDFEDEDILRHNRKAEALRESAVLEAKNHFNKLKEEFKLPEQPTEEELLKQREQQILAQKKLAEKVTNGLKPIEFKAGDNSFRMTHTDETKKRVRSFIENPEKHFVEPFIKNGDFISDEKALEYYENALFFDKESREKILAIRDKQIWDAAIEANSKEKRNVTLDEKLPSEPAKKGGNKGLDYFLKNRAR